MATKAVASQAAWTERLRRFFHGVWVELKKVHWPTRRELVTYTLVVVVSVATVGAFIWLLDSVFSVLLELVI
ncbi:MAG: preprotein translocase subunit SecE [Clostridia bacterium]|nr:preprotein translocase subunit SecE [Clostridia bacterium]MBC7348062.1 preprotein translocase subunit SecE [Clostridia bacterium]